MKCYFDNSATTRCFDSVVEIVDQVLRTDYGNPSSLHTKGVEAERLQDCGVLDLCRDQMLSAPVIRHRGTDERQIIRLRPARCKKNLFLLYF